MFSSRQCALTYTAAEYAFLLFRVSLIADGTKSGNAETVDDERVQKGYALCWGAFSRRGGAWLGGR